MKKMFFDLETTGLDKVVNGIHQISGCIEIDGVVAEYFNFKVRPKEGAVYDPEALRIGNVTESDLRAYTDMKQTYHMFIAMLAKYVDRYDTGDKFFLVGYNNASFDNQFLRQWFADNGDQYFGSWFWPNTLDVYILATQYLLDERQSMKDFKLKSVAAHLGLLITEDKLHDAEYDIELTRNVYRIVTNQIAPKQVSFAALDELPF